MVLTLSILLTSALLMGEDPRDKPPPVIYGEDIDADCPIDVDIHLPAAQDPAQPLVPEGQDATDGSWTLRNDDMDAPTGEIIRARLRNGTDLIRAEGQPDLAINGAVAGEDDLVAVDVHNPNSLTNVYLNVYAMAAQQGRTLVDTHANEQSANRIAGRLGIWRNADRTGAVALPLAVPGPRDRIWIEGLGAGRYRFVLLYIQNGTPAQAADVKATEIGNPHGQTTQGTITLKPPAGVKIVCFRHVRLTVAASDIFQQSAREHLFDVLWGGRPVFDARVWPGGGAYTWLQSAGFAGAWLQGLVHGARVAPNGQAPAGNRPIHELHGAFEPVVQPVGQPILGSQRYEHRVRLRYQVEGVTLERDEPVTLMVPDHVTIHPDQLLGQGFARPHWGTTYAFTLKAQYRIFDQHDRKLVGPGGAAAYSRQYGTRLQAYEALGMGTNAAEVNDRVQWRYLSPINPSASFTLNIGTKQRRDAIPQDGSLSSGDFNDSFGLMINNQQRRILQDDIRANEALASRRVFAVSQDIVVLLRNGATDYDVRVARGNRLEILAPQQRATPAAQWGGMGFQMTLGGAGGTQLDTGTPDRVGPAHNPPAP